MNKELYKKNKAYATELLEDLQTREEEGEFDGNRNTEWKKKYNALEVAVVDLAREIGGNYSLEDLPALAAIYDTLAAFVFGNVDAYFFNEDGNCDTLEKAIAVNIVCDDCNADYHQAPCAHTCMGDTIAQYIADAVDPREYRDRESDNMHQRDEITLYK